MSVLIHCTYQLETVAEGLSTLKRISRQILRVVEISLNRSQYGGCSTKHGTPTLTQVVYKRFGARSLHRIVIP